MLYLTLYFAAGVLLLGVVVLEHLVFNGGSIRSLGTRKTIVRVCAALLFAWPYAVWIVLLSARDGDA